MTTATATKAARGKSAKLAKSAPQLDLFDVALNATSMTGNGTQ